MNKKIKSIGIIALIAVFSLIAFIPITTLAADSSVDIVLITEGNLTATINGSAGGDVSYWIDGIEVKGEFEDIWYALDEFNDTWDALNSLSSSIASTNDLASDAYGFAGMAYSYASNNDKAIYGNSWMIDNHSKVIIIHNNSINDIYSKLYTLRDSVFAFEEDYIAFKNETNTTLTNQSEEIDNLKTQLSEMNGALSFIKNSLVGAGIIVGGLYIANNRTSFKHAINNHKSFTKLRRKQHKQK